MQNFCNNLYIFTPRYNFVTDANKTVDIFEVDIPRCGVENRGW